MSEQFDVFLCHNSEDKPAVIEIAQQLRQKDIRPWLDVWELRPGFPWQKALENQITQIKSAAIFIGPNGIGPWQDQEIDAFLREFVRRRCPVIPVMLSNAPTQPILPIFLNAMMWVDFRKIEPEPLSQLIWGITGEKKLSSSQRVDTINSDQKLQDTSEISFYKPSISTFRFQYIEFREVKRKFLPFYNHFEAYKSQKRAKYFLEDLGGGIELEMVLIPATEEVLLGKTAFYRLNKQTKSTFSMSKYPITQAQWKAVSCLPKVDRFLPKTPSKFKGKDLPVESISLYDAIEFCKRLSAEFKRNYRLATESEWEYACRAGTTTKFNFGDVIDPKYANFLDERLDFRPKSTTPVGHFPYPNLFGLYDMHGNVYEWCLQQNVDWQKIYDADVTSSEIDRQGLVGIIRGGSWRDLSTGCESSHRKRREPDERSDFIGLRVVCSA